MKKAIFIFLTCIIFSLCGVSSFAESGAVNSEDPQAVVIVDENDDGDAKDDSQRESIANNNGVQDDEAIRDNVIKEASPTESEGLNDGGETSVLSPSMTISSKEESNSGQTVTSGEVGNYFTWSLDSDNTLTISGTGMTYDDYPMYDSPIAVQYSQYTEAAQRAKKAVIEEGVKSIGFGEGQGLLVGCTNLEEISLPASLEIINGFCECTSLKKVSIPQNSKAKEIYPFAFQGCSNLKYFTIPESVKNIGYGTFFGTGITRITIPENVETCDISGSSIKTVYFYGKNIDEYTFASDTLETLVLGNNIQKLPANAFKHCDNLSTILCLGTTKYNSKTVAALSDVGIYRKTSSKTITLEEYDSGFKSIIVPKSIEGYTVDKIGAYAFDGNRYIRTVQLPATITSIGPYAFYNCSKLSSLTMHKGLKTIGPFAFYGCNSMTSLILPATVTSIGERAFWNCYSLKSLTIPGSVQTVGQNAFESCTGLTTLTVGSTTTAEVLRNMFVDEVYAASSTGLKINPYAFKNCKNLKKVTLGPRVKSIGTGAFYNCNKITNVTIGKNVASIGPSAFYGCTAMTSLNIPNSVTAIGASAFYNCNKISSLSLGDNVKTIGANAFAYCKGIKKVTLGKNVAAIGSKAFFNCSNLKTITIKTKLLKKSNVGSKAFKGIKKKATFKVPKKKFKAYKKMLKKRGATKKMKFKKIKKL